MDYTERHRSIPISSISAIIYCNCSLGTGTGKRDGVGIGKRQEKGRLMADRTVCRSSDESENSLNMTGNCWYFISLTATNGQALTEETNT